MYSYKIEGVPIYGVPMDFKAGAKYRVNILNPGGTKTELYAGTGAYGFEFKSALSNSNELSIKFGLQEDWSKTIFKCKLPSQAIFSNGG